MQKAVRGEMITIPVGAVGKFRSYCEGQDCPGRDFEVLVKADFDPIEVRPEHLRCPLCGKHTSTWAEFLTYEDERQTEEYLDMLKQQGVIVS